MTEMQHISTAGARPAAGRVNRVCRRTILARLAGLDQGRLVIRDSDGEHVLGVLGGAGAPDARVEVHDPRFWRMLATGGSVGAGEAYVARLWDSPDLVAVVSVLARNRELLGSMEQGGARTYGWLLKLLHRFNRNSLEGSRRNISAHYDLGNDFFATWLDRRMQYSCALFESGDESLEVAQERKLERICNRLALSPGDHLAEIGTGWGGLAIFAAANHGCRVTTITISREQHEYARKRVREAGLEDRVEVRLQDYRELEGRFDKLVSVEMIEAVGAEYLDTYLEKVASLLKPDGLALIQAITIEEFRYAGALGRADFIQRYIFPGSFIPSVGAIMASAARATDLGLVELADIGSSYALTLKAWRERFEAAWPEIRAMGFDEAFRRRWRFYLAYCEGGFRERAISDVHLLLARPGFRPGPGLPLRGAAG